MSNKHRNKDQYIQSGNAPITYDDEVDSNENKIDETTETASQQTLESDSAIPAEVPANNEPKVEEKPEESEQRPEPVVASKVDDHSDTTIEVVKKSKNTLPPNINNNLMRVRIVGNRSMNGIHMMYPFAIANAVIESNGKFSIIVSRKTVPLIVEIIRNHSEEFGKVLDSAKKESIIARFIADVKRTGL